MRRIAAVTLTFAVAACRSASGVDAGPQVAAPLPAALAEIDAALAKRQQGDSATATTMLLDAAAHAKDAKDLPGQAWALHRAGDTLLDQDRCGPSRARYLEALELHQLLHDRAKVGLAANDLGLWARRCEFDEALGWFSLATLSRRDDPKGLATSANNLGQTFWNLNRPDEAQVAWDEALGAAERAKEPVLERKVLANLALLWVLRAEGRYDTDPLEQERSIEALLARAEASLAGDAGPDAMTADDVIAELERRRTRFEERDPAMQPIAEGSPALARARDYFRRSIEAARRAGEDPLVVCNAFGVYDDRCELLSPKTP